jgi:hypothetical protein
MKFNNLEDLVKYIIHENINLKYFDLDFKVDLNENVAPPATVTESTSVILEMFSDSPTVDATFGDENILFVESFEALKNACGSGKIRFMGREIISNICEMDDTAHITLPIKIDDKTSRVEFILKTADTSSIQLKRS